MRIQKKNRRKITELLKPFERRYIKKIKISHHLFRRKNPSRKTETVSDHEAKRFKALEISKGFVGERLILIKKKGRKENLFESAKLEKGHDRDEKGIVLRRILPESGRGFSFFASI